MRWHVSNAAYGEQWAAGDVIGCLLDLDAGSMRFVRNGRDLVRAAVARPVPAGPSVLYL
jgi:Kip1 ubiquitination-promoting complex protein 1